MTQNMYRVGDYVYLESFASSPYQIRRIEELNKVGPFTTYLTFYDAYAGGERLQPPGAGQTIKNIILEE